MALKRTMVYADADDLAVIKEAAKRERVPEAEIIRNAIHLAALAKRTWDRPLAFAGVADGPGNLAGNTRELLAETFSPKDERENKKSAA